MLIFLTQMLIYYKSNPIFFDYFQIYFCLFATISTAAAGYVINDFFDQKIDLINKAQKTIIGKSISANFAIKIYIFFAVLTLIFSVFLPLQIQIIQFFSWLALFLYSKFLKKMALIGNLLISVLTVFSVLLPSILTNFWNNQIILLAIFAFLLTFVRELLKDVEDIEGDKIGNCKTFPIIFGLVCSKNLLLLLLLLFIFPLFALFFLFKFCFIHLFFIGFIIYLFYFAWQIRVAKQKKDFANLSLQAKIMMLFGLITLFL
ncbi:MAG: hypothetical protein EAZ97_13170 [Bacteroidetes bacterium]|nr:MAG: hypothetical protein EAZ97_13170 [Bacteroidota bacterium]